MFLIMTGLHDPVLTGTNCAVFGGDPDSVRR